MAAPALHPSTGAAAGQLVLAGGGGFMPPRLLLAPVGVRLPPGVHAVAAPALQEMDPVALALGGSGGRAIRLLPRAASVSAAAPDDDDDYDEGAAFFYDFLCRQKARASWVLKKTVPIPHDGCHWPLVIRDFTYPPEELAIKFNKVRKELDEVMLRAEQHHPDKMDCAVRLVRGCYGVIEVVDAFYTGIRGLPPVALPGERAFLSMCGLADLAPPSVTTVIMGEEIASLHLPDFGCENIPRPVQDLMLSVSIAVSVCIAVSGDAERRRRKAA